MHQYKNNTKNIIYSGISNVEADLISTKSVEVAEREYLITGLLT